MSTTKKIAGVPQEIPEDGTPYVVSATTTFRKVSGADHSRTHGDGRIDLAHLPALGHDVVIEDGVRIWHPENITLGSRVYVGHGTMLKGYYGDDMVIGEGTWIGQMCFFHSAGGLLIGQNVGIGPCVKIFTSYHKEVGRGTPILHAPLEFAGVDIGDDCDIGVGAVILPGTVLGKGVQVGAGAVVKGTFDDYSVIAGVPARELRRRPVKMGIPPHESGIYDDSWI